MVTPEMAQRLRSLCTLVGGLILRREERFFAGQALATGEKRRHPVSTDRFTDLPRSEATEDSKCSIPAEVAGGIARRPTRKQDAATLSKLSTPMIRQVKRMPLKRPEGKDLQVGANKGLGAHAGAVCHYLRGRLLAREKGSESVSAKPDGNSNRLNYAAGRGESSASGQICRFRSWLG